MPTDPLLLDGLLVLVLAGAAVSGWRMGLVLSLASALGLVAGGAAAAWALPALIARVDALQRSLPLRAGTLCLGVLVGATLGQVLLGAVGLRVRARARARALRLADAGAGAVASLVVGVLVAWCVGDTLRAAAPGQVARLVAGSRVLRAADRVVPDGVVRGFAGLRREVADSEFPRVFDRLSGDPIAPVLPPDPAVTRTPGVLAARRSVVRVMGQAPACSREQDGSGWVSAAHHVVTNAHVVAGTESVRVQVGGEGRSYDAVVVAVDPRLDLATLDVPGLPATPLAQAGDLTARQSGVVAGFPGDGPYRLGAARVRSVQAAKGSDIYGRPGVVREVYSLYATVRPGASGGPLLTTDGRVAGTVFATSVDDAQTGYALTSAATRAAIADGARRSTRVDTGACTSR